MGGKKWSEKEDIILQQIFKSGISVDEMSEKLNRSPKAISLRAHTLGLTKKSSKKHLFSVGQTINGNLLIIKQIRMKLNIKYKNGQQKTTKGYVVQSLIYPDAPTYELTEYDLKRGSSCGYASFQRLFEGNSLWSKVELRKYIVDIEEAKNSFPNQRKPVLFKCPNCDREKHMIPNNLMKRGFFCEVCDKGTSYPELFFMAYLETKKIDYETQVRFLPSSQARFDFKIKLNNNIYYVETHGRQHYEKGNCGYIWKDAYTKTQISDGIKRKYCKDNNCNLIEIDCRESTFEFIQQQVNNNIILPNIDKCDVLEMLRFIEYNKSYDVKTIVKMYNDGNTAQAIGKFMDISNVTVINILKRNNIKLRGNGKKVKCITTNTVFNSITEASKKYNTHNSYITKCCSGKRESAGELNGTPLKWKYVEEE